MARLPRIVMPGHPHVIIHRGRSGHAVFLDAADSASYFAALSEAARVAKVDVHAYALLACEIRILARPETASGLADMMQAVGRRYVPAFNTKHGRTGTPWEGRFRSTVIEAERHFLTCLRFVEAWGEAVGGAAAAAAVPPLTSAGHHLGLRIDPLVVDHPAFWAFGNTPFEREAAYRQFVDQAPAQGEVAAILLATLNGWVLGSPEFRAMVTPQTGRRAQPAARGRPRKSGARRRAGDLPPFS